MHRLILNSIDTQCRSEVFRAFRRVVGVGVGEGAAEHEAARARRAVGGDRVRVRARGNVCVEDVHGLSRAVRRGGVDEGARALI